MTARLIGVIADTHGLIRAEALEALRGADLIVHAGDVGKAEVLAALESIARVAAVRGNVDRTEPLASLPATRVVTVAGLALFVLHSLDDLDLDPAAAGFRAVISGHSHRADIRREDGVLYLNPGSAGPRRFTLPLTLIRLSVADSRLDPELITLRL